MTTTRSASSAINTEVVRDQDDRGVRLLPRRLQHLDDLRLDRDVERGRRLVRDEHARVVGDRHRDHRALAHPAGELVRVLVDPPLRRRDADDLEQLDRALAARRRRSCPGCASGPPRRSGYRRVSTGFSDVIGSWKIIAMSPPRISRSRFCDSFNRSSPLKSASPLGIRALGHQPEDGQHRDALARARLADDAEHLARLEVVGHIRDRLDDAVLGLELDCQITNRKNRIRHELSAGSDRAHRAGRRRRS